MKNVDVSVDKKILTIKVDLTKEYGESNSGKTMVVASTEGPLKLSSDPSIIVGLNVNRKKNQ